MPPESTVTPALMPSYARADVAFVRGEGAYLYADDGRRFLDFASGVAVTALGHCHPRLVAALNEQAGALWHCSNLFRIPGQERLAERLAAASFAERAFFCNSGAEAVEAGLKLCRKYHADAGHPERYRVITFEGSFHGRTLATISAGASDAHRKGFGPPLDAFDRVPYGNFNEVRGAISGETAAILVEPVQGEGGVNVGADDFLRELRRICDEFGLLLFLDEVQTGIGRTGRLFAHEWAGITPDVMALAKGLGGGFPVGACLATAKAAAGITPGTHGSTFGGNPLAMAVANAVLDVVLDDGLLDHVVAVGERLKERLAALVANHPGVVAEVRGRGLLLGLKCVAPAGDVVAALRSHGLLSVPAADNVVRLLPPLIIDDSHVSEAIGMMDLAFRELAP